jgi:hypothetical protein
VNEAELAVHPLSRPRRPKARKLMFGPENTWLTKRRDGASSRWMIAWYDPGTRNVRYRSTGTDVLARAKEMLVVFQLPENARTLPARTRRVSDQIYFIGGDTGAIKIGLARSPERRLISLQCGSPIQLRILAQGPGSQRDERALHQRFAAHRLHGEWFEPHPTILAEIARLNSEASA